MTEAVNNRPNWLRMNDIAYAAAQIGIDVAVGFADAKRISIRAAYQAQGISIPTDSLQHILLNNTGDFVPSFAISQVAFLTLEAFNRIIPLSRSFREQATVFTGLALTVYAERIYTNNGDLNDTFAGVAGAFGALAVGRKLVDIFQPFTEPFSYLKQLKG